ncbi:SulP family inorganic anion transporter, partial [bacterium]|nr:SulP family inorganic anion transporter [bacterium]
MRSDVISGLTVAVLGIPQGMAYAAIAGIHPIYGLYTSIVSCVIGALFGSSSHLLTGPTNASCMVIFSVTAPYLNLDNHLEVIFLLTLMVGLVKVAFGLLRMGGVVRYVSNSVVLGFTTGVAILIMGNQIRNVLGVGIDPEKTRHFYSVVIASLARIPDGNLYTFAVAAATFMSVIAMRRLTPKLPGPLLAIVGASFLVYLLGWDSHGVRIVRDMGSIPGGLRLFHIPKLLWPPDIGLYRELSAGALAVAIFGLIEASTSSRGVAGLSGQRLNFSREFIGQGLANIAGAFSQSFASSGSFVRTALCYTSGGRTRMAPVFSAIFVALIVLLLAPYANYIPQASLAGMLFYVAWSMVSKQSERLTRTWRSGGNSRLVLATTLISTLVLPLQYAIFVGVFLSIFLLLKITGRTDLSILVPQEDGSFNEVPVGQEPNLPIALINMEGDLYFAAVENLDLELHEALTPSTQVVVLRMKGLRAVGSTAMNMMEKFWQSLHE